MMIIMNLIAVIVNSNGNSVRTMFIIVDYYGIRLYIYYIDIKVDMSTYRTQRQSSFFAAAISDRDRDHPTTTRYRTFRREPGRFRWDSGGFHGDTLIARWFDERKIL